MTGFSFTLKFFGELASPNETSASVTVIMTGIGVLLQTSLFIGAKNLISRTIVHYLGWLIIAIGIAFSASSLVGETLTYSYYGNTILDIISGNYLLFIVPILATVFLQMIDLYNEMNS